MNLNKYLADTFHSNDATNKILLTKIESIPDKAEALRLFSHLINCQYKWMARIVHDPDAPMMSWWDPVYPLDELADQWTKSLQLWFDYIAAHSEEELEEGVTFIGLDNNEWNASPKDIALQLNYHSIHHRAQIQTLLRQQGLAPDFVDYIGTRYRKVN